MSDLPQNQESRFDVTLSSAPEKTKLEIKSSFAEFLAKADEYSEIIDNLEIKGIDDKAGLDEARKARLFLKNQRGEAKRLTESKRNEIKALKLEYDLADSAWLKTFQFIESVYKPIEEKAEEKEKYVEKLKADLVAKLKTERNEKMSQYSDVELPNLELLSEEVFQKMLDNYRMANEARIRAEKEAEAQRLEDERIEKERQETIKRREEEIKPFYSFFEVPAMQIIGDLTEEEYQEKLTEAKQAKSDHEAEQERIRLENERLKKEADEEKQRREVRAAELKPYTEFVSNEDYFSLLSVDEKFYKKRFSEIKSDAETVWEANKILQDLYKANENKFELTLIELGYEKDERGMTHPQAGFIGRAHYSEMSDFGFDIHLTEVVERVEKIKAFNEQKRKDAVAAAEKQAELDRVQAELAAEKQRQADKEAAEKKAEDDRIAAEKALALSGDKNRLKNWVDNMTVLGMEEEGLSEESVVLAREIFSKFESFKNWAVKQVEKL